MEVSTIIGIVVAIIICIVGLRMILRKPNDAAPSLDSAVHINEDTQKPVIPRHVRNQLQADAVKSNERVEPSLAGVESAKEESNAVAEQAIAKAQVEEVALTHSAESKVEQLAVEVETAQTEIATPTSDKAETQVDANQNKNDQNEAKPNQPESNGTDAEPVKSSTSDFALNSNVETAKIEEFNEESSILDVHLHEQQRFDDESTLANAETIIALNVYPNPRKALSGDKTLKVLLKYGLRFGEMNCFHRYEDPENSSPLLFSVLRITDEGPAGFDLEALLVEQVKGLAFFLALPHQNVQKGYDSMVSIAGLIARETDGTVYDENNLEFTPQLKEHWRHKAIDYRAGQNA